MKLRIDYETHTQVLTRRETAEVEKCRYRLEAVAPDCLTEVSHWYAERVPDGDGSVDVLSLCLHALRCGQILARFEAGETLTITTLPG